MGWELFTGRQNAVSLPTATVTNTGLRLNKAAAQLVKDWPRVRLLHDRAARKIALQPAPVSDEFSFALTCAPEHDPNTARITCWPFCRFMGLTIRDRIVLTPNEHIPAVQLDGLCP